MARVHYETRLAAERRFQHRIDVTVPPGGLGGRLNQMQDWCRANIKPDAWAQHHASTREPGQIPQDYARFYFDSEEDADLFCWKWVTP
jgi:hypothetical protein